MVVRRCEADVTAAARPSCFRELASACHIEPARSHDLGMGLLDYLGLGNDKAQASAPAPAAAAPGGAHESGGVSDWLSAIPAAGAGLANMFGKKPGANDVGPYGYIGLNKSGWGLDYGFGLKGGSNADLLSFNGSGGLMTDDKGNTRFGARFGGGLAKVGGTGPDGDVSVDAGGGTIAGDWSVGTDGASLGGAANIAEGNATAKHLPFGTSVHAGLSAGEGAALRLHWGDEDGNGIREFGFGADAGPGSFDIKTEAPGRIYNWLTGKK